MNKYFNFIEGTLADAISNTDTAIEVVADLLPTLEAGDWFYTVLDYSKTNGDPEIVKVTAVSGDTLTVERGAYSTIARAHASGTVFGHGILAEDMDDLAYTSYVDSALEDKADIDHDHDGTYEATGVAASLVDALEDTITYVPAAPSEAGKIIISTVGGDWEVADLPESGETGLNHSVGLFVSDMAMTTGDFTELDPYGFDFMVPRESAVGASVLVVNGADVGIWTITASGPCTPGPELLVTDTIGTVSFQGMIAKAGSDPESNLFVSVHVNENMLTAALSEIDTVQWPPIHGVMAPAEVAIVGQGPRTFTTPDIGPLDTDGFSITYRVALFAPDESRLDPEVIGFSEILTKFIEDTWGGDQDLNEDALTYMGGHVGIFHEMVREGDPFPVSSGEWADGRFYSAYDNPEFSIPLGGFVEVHRTLEYDVDGSTRHRFYYRVTINDEYDLITDGWAENPEEAKYWKLLTEKVTAGVITLADQPTLWRIGVNNGIWGVEQIELYKGIADPEIFLHFRAADRQADGTVASSAIPGQVWTPNATPLFLDNNPETIALRFNSIEEEAEALSTALDDKADVDHNHDTEYATITHDHDTEYAALVHNHDTAYAPLVHTHSNLPNNIWLHQVVPMLGWKASSGTPVRSINSARWMGGYVDFQNAATPGQWIEWNLGADAGTWDLTVFGDNLAINGTSTFSLDGVNFGTMNQYAASTSIGVVYSITGVTVPTNGAHVFRMTNTAPGVAAGTYGARVSAFNWRRTA